MSEVETERCCKACEQVKPIEKFGLTGGYTSGKYRKWTCKACMSKRARDAQKALGPKFHQRRRELRLFNRYGITLEDYRRTYDDQGGKCAVCLKSEEYPDIEATEVNRTLVVDHSHTTGKARGLLCHSCNRAIGLLQDNPEFVRRAAEYLDRHLEG